MDPSQHRVDAIRARSSELENHLIDELRAGRSTDANSFVAAPSPGCRSRTLGFIASACGVSKEDLEQADKPQTDKPKPGGTIRLGLQAPAGELDPVTVNNQGGLTCSGRPAST